MGGSGKELWGAKERIEEASVLHSTVWLAVEKNGRKSFVQNLGADGGKEGEGRAKRLYHDLTQGPRGRKI